MIALDPDRILALSYVPAARRAALGALWRLDAVFGAALAGATEPMIGRIKLAWWREALERLDHSPPPAEPTLQALSRDVLPAGVSGAELASMEEGWAVLGAEDALSAEELQAYAEGRGATLFRLSARLLGAEASSDQLRSGEGWALADLARHSGEPDAGSAIAAAREKFGDQRWPKPLRPLGMLAALARRDVEIGLGAQGSPSRMVRMLRHRLTGR